MPGPPAARFRVIVPPDQAAEVRRITWVGTVIGNHASVARWFREIEYRLLHEADEWGESRGRYPGDRVEVRFGVAGDVVVWYAVDFARAVAYVREFRLRGDPGAGAVGAT